MGGLRSALLHYLEAVVAGNKYDKKQEKGKKR